MGKAGRGPKKCRRPDHRADARPVGKMLEAFLAARICEPVTVPIFITIRLGVLHKRHDPLLQLGRSPLWSTSGSTAGRWKAGSSAVRRRLAPASVFTIPNVLGSVGESIF